MTIAPDLRVKAAWFDSVASCVLVRDVEGNIVGYNRAAERALGPALFPLEGWFQRAPILDEHGDPIDQDATPSTIVARTGIASVGKVIRLADPRTGAHRWLRTDSEPLFDEAGQLQGVVITFQDITSLKQAEARERFAVELLEWLGASVTLEEFAARAFETVREHARLGTLALEVPSPATGKLLRFGETGSADAGRERVKLEHGGWQLGAFSANREEDVRRPGAIPFLKSIAPLVAQGLLRFQIEEELEVTREAEHVLAAIRGVALADSPSVFEETLALLAGVPFLGPDNGLFLTLDAERPGERPCHLERHGVGCPRDPATGAAVGCGRHRFEVPIGSSRGERYGRLLICARAERERSPRELAFLQAVADTLGTTVERRRTAEAIALAQARHRRFVEHCREGIWELDSTGRVLYANARLEELLGVREGSLMGASCWSFVLDEDRPDLEARLRAIRDGAASCFDLRLRDLEGRVLHTMISAVTAPGTDGQPPCVVGLITDVTNLRRAEELARQAQKMEALGRLAGTVAHDFNNLLSVILGTSDLLLCELEQGDPKAADVEEIREAARRGARLTKQLLGFSRLGPGDPEVVDPRQTVTGMEGLLRRAVGERIELALAASDAVPSVRIDPGQLEQVLLNLAVNARDAMPRGGQLSIATRAVWGRPAPSVPGPGHWVELRVSDTGEGIPEESLPRIFDPFFTTKAKDEGTGLGLATVFGIVEKARGRIAVESRLGQGTTFTIWLPAVNGEPSVVRLEAARPVAPAAGGETILVADDDDGVRALARRVLCGHGYRVLEAEDGERALALLVDPALRIDLLVGDAVMPRLGTPELLARLSPASRPPVLLTSGYAGHRDRAGSDDEADAFLAKPFAPNALLSAVERLLGARRRQVAGG